MEILKFIWDFLLIFALIYIIYSVFFNKKRKDYKDLKKNDEIKFFIKKYDLDMRKTKYKSLLRTLTFINSFIISLETTIVLYIDNYVVKIIVCFISSIILLYVLYTIIGNYYKKKENEENV